VWIKGGFGSFTLGDTDGAMDWALTEAGNIGNPGSIADNETGHGGYVGSYLDGFQDGQIGRYDNSFGDFGVAISVDGTKGYAIGAKYNVDMGGASLALGVGYQRAVALPGTPIGGIPVFPTAVGKTYGVSAVVSTDNGLSAGINYAHYTFNGINPANQIGVGVGYNSGPLSLHANYTSFKINSLAQDRKGFGLAAGYDLGGGAKVLAGYGHSNINGATSSDWSLGMALSF
jgi:outer membrane protein OmpU